MNKDQINPNQTEMEDATSATVRKSRPFIKWAVIVLVAIALPAVSFFFASKGEEKSAIPQVPFGAFSASEARVSLSWSDIGKKLVETGVIDIDKLSSIYALRGGISQENANLLSGRAEYLVMTPENADFALNLLWAFGLSNKNAILENGPMTDARYGGDPSRFASTGGWTISKGDVMNHYSAHSFVILSEEEQEKVERVSKGIYRPCCGNSVHFPDCNHGMAMLGLLELMAAGGASENEMYSAAFEVNAMWFPDTYAVIGEYLRLSGSSFSGVGPRVVLGEAYSSARGYQNILAQVETREQRGGSCGI